MAVKLQTARYKEERWEKLLYKLEALVDRIEMLLRRVRS